jgi:hypothetical protein
MPGSRCRNAPRALAALEGAFGGAFVPGLPLAAAGWFFDLPGGLWTA